MVSSPLRQACTEHPVLVRRRCCSHPSRAADASERMPQLQCRHHALPTRWRSLRLLSRRRRRAQLSATLLRRIGRGVGLERRRWHNHRPRCVPAHLANAPRRLQPVSALRRAPMTSCRPREVLNPGTREGGGVITLAASTDRPKRAADRPEGDNASPPHPCVAPTHRPWSESRGTTSAARVCADVISRKRSTCTGYRIKSAKR